MLFKSNKQIQNLLSNNTAFVLFYSYLMIKDYDNRMSMDEFCKDFHVYLNEYNMSKEEVKKLFEDFQLICFKSFDNM